MHLPSHRAAPFRKDIAVENLSRHLRLVSTSGMAPLDPFQHVAKLRRRDRHRIADSRRPYELAVLQPLGVERHAVAIMPENLQQIAALAPEHEQIAGVGIPLQHLLRLQRRSVHILADDDAMAARQHDLDAVIAGVVASSGRRRGELDKALRRSRRRPSCPDTLQPAPAEQQAHRNPVLLRDTGHRRGLALFDNRCLLRIRPASARVHLVHFGHLPGHRDGL